MTRVPTVHGYNSYFRNSRSGRLSLLCGRIGSFAMLLALLALGVLWQFSWPWVFGRRLHCCNSRSRILVLSTRGGAGKTTLARQLAQAYGLTHISLDDCKYGAQWKRRTAEEFQHELKEALIGAQDRWVVEGLTDDPLLPEYELEVQKLIYTDDQEPPWVIVLDVPKYVALWRVFKRSLLRRCGWEAQGSAPETWKNVVAVLKKGWNNNRSLPQYLALAPNCSVVRFPWFVYVEQ